MFIALLGRVCVTMWLKLLLLFIFVTFVRSGEVGEKCVPIAGVSNGLCMIISDCKVAVRAIRQNFFHSFTRCGFQDTTEIVCCPPDDYVLPGKEKNSEQPKTTSKPPTSTTVSLNKHAEETPKRVADIECQKIRDKSGPPLDLHIVGGTKASDGEFPHMAALAYNHETGYRFQCGGSLISEMFVLTAAHCVNTLDRITPEFARMGGVYLGKPTFNETTDKRIIDILTFPAYTSSSKYNDLALLRLEKPVEFTDFVSPICLYTPKSDPEVDLVVTGWGKTDFKNDDSSEILLKAKLNVVPNSKCREHYKENWRRLAQGITETQVCAVDKDGKKDSCQGDSGGPLQALTSTDSRYRLVGITSFGRGCGSAVPGVYTRVAHYIDWIEAIVWPQTNL